MFLAILFTFPFFYFPSLDRGGYAFCVIARRESLNNMLSLHFEAIHLTFNVLICYSFYFSLFPFSLSRASGIESA